MNTAIGKLIYSNVLKNSKRETILMGTKKNYYRMPTDNTPYSFQNYI